MAVLRAAEGATVMSPYPRVPEVSVVVYGGGQSQSAYQGHNVSAINIMFPTVILIYVTIPRLSSTMVGGGGGSRSFHELHKTELGLPFLQTGTRGA